MGAISVPTTANSGDTARLEAAETTRPETFILSHVILACLGFVLVVLILRELPRTFFRMRHWGFLTGAMLFASAPKLSVAPSTPSQKSLVPTPPRRTNRPFFLPSYTIPHSNLSLAQALLVLAAFILIMVTSFVHSNPLKDSTRTGYLALTLVPLVIVLGNKVFGVGTFLSVGYAGVNFAHRWLGRFMFLITTIHVAMYLVIFAQAHSFHEEMSTMTNVLAIVSYLGLCLIIFGSVVRKTYWRMYKVCHHFGIFLFIVGLNFHSSILRPWVLFSVAAVGISVISRILTSRLHTGYLTALPASSSTIVHLPSVRSGWIPGQIVRVRVLTGGMGLTEMWEAHPFTIAAAPGAGEGARLIIKDAGDWTHALFQVASKATTRSPSFWRKDVDLESGAAASRGYPVSILVEGPYGGCNLVYSAYPSVLLAAGGSGVSYLMTIAEGIISDARAGRAATKDLHLVWITRERESVDEMMELFGKLVDGARGAEGLRIVVDLFATSGGARMKVMADEKVEEEKIEHVEHVPIPMTQLPPPIHLVDSQARPIQALLPSPSSVSSKLSPSSSINIKTGRPDFTALLHAIVQSAQPSIDLTPSPSGVVIPTLPKPNSGRIAVGACGPPGMVKSLRELSLDMEGVDFWAEQYSL